MTDTLFTPTKLGDIEIANRVVMAPLTRNRAPETIPTDTMVEYYRQRASMGLIISEGTQVSRLGQGYAWTPGIWTEAQGAGWRKITDAVHAEGGKIVAQLWHVGRISHPSLLDGALPIAPSAIDCGAKTFDGTGFVNVPTPRALALDEIPGVVDEFRKAARIAMDAGFDGVEIHGANGYLIDQFLRDTSNKRTDAYGGSIENRIRFAREIVEAVTQEVGAGRVGIRISPFSNANNVGLDSDTEALFGSLIEVLNGFDLAYVHGIEGQTGGERDHMEGMGRLIKQIRAPYIANNGYDGDLAESAVEGEGATGSAGAVAAVAFGRMAIANPDLVARLKADGPFNDLNADRLYGGGADGYTDYPFLTA